MAKETESKDIAAIDESQIHQSVLDITTKAKYEIMRCQNCPIVMECDYSMKKIDKLKEEAKKNADAVYDEELELDKSAENTLRAQRRQKEVYDGFIRDNAHRVLEHDRCIYEKREIITSLQRFVDAGYNLGDPRVHLIVNELVSNILLAGRANKAFTNLGMVLRKDTPGGPVYYNNPVLRYRQEFSKLIMECTEALDRMLKSDETQSANAKFTNHMIQLLNLRQKKTPKQIVLDGLDNDTSLPQT